MGDDLALKEIRMLVLTIDHHPVLKCGKVLGITTDDKTV